MGLSVSQDRMSLREGVQGYPLKFNASIPHVNLSVNQRSSYEHY